MSINLGDKFGEWTLIGPPADRTKMRTHVECECSCGRKYDVNWFSLKYGRSTRCRYCAIKAKDKNERGEWQCFKCKEWKDSKEFGIHLGTSNKLQSHCKLCAKVCAKELKRKNKEDLFGDSVCAICGVSNHVFLVWHHKVMGRESKIPIHQLSKAKRIEEVKKCVCLCYNHHNAFHTIYSTHTFPDWSDEIEEELRKLDLYENGTSAACSK